MAKSTILRVIKGQVGVTALGDTFNAEKSGLGPKDITRLLSLKVVEIVSGEAPTLPATGYTEAERADVDASIDRMEEMYELVEADLKAAREEIETLTQQAESTTKRSNEIAEENVAARAQVVRALGAIGQRYDETMSTPALATAMADAVDAYVNKKTEDILRDRMMADAGKQPPVQDETVPKSMPAANGEPLTTEQP